MLKKGIPAIIAFSLLFCGLIIPAHAAADKNESSIEVFFNDPGNKKDRTLQEMIIGEINNATDRIYVATYNFTDTKSAEALIKAARQGVEVRLVIHSENSDNDLIRNLDKNGIHIRKSNSDGLMHAKYLVIDNDLTISGSANMTVGSFFYDNNYMIRIISPEVNAIFRDEFNEMFIDKKFGSNSPKSKPASIITLDDGTRLLIRFSPEDGINNTLLSLVNAAKESIYVLAYSFASNDLGQALINRYDQGLDVIVIFEEEKAFTDSGGEAEFLEKAGVPIYLDGNDGNLMHEKVIIFDETVVSAGSYNFTRSAETRNDEQVLIIQNEDIVDAFMEEFDKIYADAR
jgi:phosphatidylserine/phosphatidylglycerophosphate/cardiolipin synthase-like enzyme